jgi:hypothetical protein
MKLNSEGKLKKVTLALSVAVVGLFVAGVVFAQSTNGNTSPGNTGDTSQKIGQMNGCENVENNLQKRVQTFEANRNRSVDQFEKIRLRLSNLVDTLEDEGYDVVTLRADLVTFEGMVYEYKQNHESYMYALGESRTYACSRTEGEFKAKLTTTRTRLKAVHENGVALKTFWAKTLREDLQALKVTTEGSL